MTNKETCQAKEQLNIIATLGMIEELKDEKKIYKILKKRISDVNLYFDIQKSYNTNSLDALFEKKFKQFYRMNTAGLTQKHFEVYFEFLRNKEKNLKTILKKLYNIKTLSGRNSLQFSFATKLLHTLDTSLPIYDKHVGLFFSIPTPNDTTLSLADRLEKRFEMFNKLSKDFANLLSDKQIYSKVKNCRKEFDWSGAMISDAKVLDFMLWAAGQIVQYDFYNKNA